MFRWELLESIPGTVLQMVIRTSAHSSDCGPRTTIFILQPLYIHIFLSKAKPLKCVQADLEGRASLSGLASLLA